MPTLATSTTTIQDFRAERFPEEAELAAAAFLTRLQRPDPRRLPPRPAHLLPAGHRPRPDRPRGDPALHQALPRSVAAVPAPHWFFRFMYDRESAAWERRRYEPEHRELA